MSHTTCDCDNVIAHCFLDGGYAEDGRVRWARAWIIRIGGRVFDLLCGKAISRDDDAKSSLQPPRNLILNKNPRVAGFEVTGDKSSFPRPDRTRSLEAVPGSVV